MACARLRATMLLLMLTATLVTRVICHCDPVEHGAEGDNAIPDFFEYFKSDFTLMLEMTELFTNHTNYVHHSHFVGNSEGVLIETDAVRIIDEGSLIVYHYFPETENFIMQFDTSCVEPSEEHPMYIPYGWFDEDKEHGVKTYGPATVLRSTHFEPARYDGGGFMVHGIMSEKWYICIGEEVEINLYFSERDKVDMPQKDMFDDGKIDNRLPVMFEVLTSTQSEQIGYTIVNILPELTRDTGLETPRGLACEDKVSIEPGRKPPKMPSHMSWSEEIIDAPMIDGIRFKIDQTLDKFQVTYCKPLSMVKLLSTPPADIKETDQYPDKIVHDFNTGVEYSISRKSGKCERRFIPEYSFDKTHVSGMGAAPEMAGPQELFFLDDTYAYVGPRMSRSIVGDLFTSTRNDIPDPEFEFIMPYPKAVLEHYFSKSTEVTPIGIRPVVMPLRTDLFIYNKTEQTLLNSTYTINYYDFKEIALRDTDEFSVNECFDRYDDDWSTFYIFFPATKVQFAAEEANVYEFKHYIYGKLLEAGDISPARIGSIDISDGTSGWYSNTTDADVIIASIKLMERAPYIYGYRKPDEPNEIPGDEEAKHVFVDKEECAELCSLSDKRKCKSFHFCPKEVTCYLSDNIGAQGPQTLNYTCEHYIDNHENLTFDDLPTHLVKLKLNSFIHDKKFNFSMKFNDMDVIFTAAESIMYNSPDPLDPIRNQFSTYQRHHTIDDPDAEITLTEDKTLTACLALCLGWEEFKCETVVHNFVTGNCGFYSQHVTQMNSSRFHLSVNNYIHSRNYLGDYKMMLGGVSINTTGPIVKGESPEDCARNCTGSTIGDSNCNSFEYCWEDSTCHLHVETFLDVSGGGDYHTDTKCIHFEKKAEQIFTRYPNQGMPNKYHKLVAQLTDVSACARICLEDTSETCQSYDFCTLCQKNDYGVCGSENKGGLNMCFIGDHHLGEPDLSLDQSVNCEHFSRDLFGDQDYASWIASQRKSTKPYTGGSMAGLAFGMIFLGIILALGTIFALTKFRPGTLPKDIKLGDMSSSGTSNVSFGNLSSAGGESDI